MKGEGHIVVKTDSVTYTYKASGKANESDTELGGKTEKLSTLRKFFQMNLQIS